MLFVWPLGLLVLGYSASVLAGSSTPFTPPSVPLVVSSPYLNTWIPQSQGGKDLNAGWPSFWDASTNTLGWAGQVMVDSKPYLWLGAQENPTASLAVQQSMEFTSTQSIFVMRCGPIDLTATFLSPVEPSDLVNQSIPFSYVSVSATPNDAGSHSVQIYMDITAEWLASDGVSSVNWTTSTGNIITHQVQLQNQSMFTESQNRVLQGSVYLSTQSTSGTTYQTSDKDTARLGFISNGKLGNSLNSTFRGISTDWPVFALAQDLGTVDWQGNKSTIFTIGHVRDPVIQYNTTSSVQSRSSLFFSRFSSVTDLISTFLSDYPNALVRANVLDKKVNSDADIAVGSSSSTPSDYAALCSLSIRQFMASLEITVSAKAGGGWNTEDILIFMRDINGGVSPTDIIYTAWPGFLYLNPEIGKYLLLPHYDSQSSSVYYPFQYAAHDMGEHYPLVFGASNPQSFSMFLEETADQLIMALSYTQKSNDTSLISKYSTLVDRWAQYLVTNAITPALQESTDGIAGPLANQTNLAIKGIVGIQAAAEIWKLLDDDDKSQNYNSIATSYAKSWTEMAYSSDKTHLTLSYGDNPSWGLMYNLYAEKLLGTDLFPGSAYQIQTSWYSSEKGTFGTPLDSRNSYTFSHWQIWAAATATDPAVRNSMIGLVKTYASNGLNSAAFPDLYDNRGVAMSVSNRAVVGGNLALLALSGTASSGPSSNTPPPPETSNNGVVKATQLPWTLILLFLGVLLLIQGN